MKHLHRSEFVLVTGNNTANATAEITGDSLSGGIDVDQEGDFRFTMPDNSSNSKSTGYEEAKRRRGRPRKLKTAEHTCSICGNCYPSLFRLRSHELTHTGDKRRRFICEICNAQFTAVLSLRKHMKRIHEGEQAIKPFSCNFCTKQYEKKYELEDHLVRFHEGEVVKGDGQYPCDICNKKFVHARYVARHRKLHVELNCEYCTKVFSGKNRLDAHLRSTHSKVTPNSTLCPVCGVTNCNQCITKESHPEEWQRFHSSRNCSELICETCGKGFSWSYELKQHRRNMGATEMCDICKIGFISRCKLEVHRSKVHGNPHTNAEDRQPVPQTVNNGVICRVCGKQYTNKWVLKRHVRIVHNPQVLKGGESGKQNRQQKCCNICNVKFRGHRQLENHIVLYHEEQVATEDGQYICDVCNKRFVSSIYLTKHKKLHVELKCKFCGKIEFTKIRCNQHILSTHFNSTQNSIQCPVCGVPNCIECITKESHPEEWERIQSVRKNCNFTDTERTCESCGEQFNWLYELHSHKRKHKDNDNSSFCDICGTYLTSMRNLRKHNEQVHNVKVESKEDLLNGKTDCTVCGEHFSSINTLRTHFILNCGRPCIAAVNVNDLNQQQRKQVTFCSTCGKYFRNNWFRAHQTSCSKESAPMALQNVAMRCLNKIPRVDEECDLTVSDMMKIEAALDTEDAIGADFIFELANSGLSPLHVKEGQDPLGTEIRTPNSSLEEWTDTGLFGDTESQTHDEGTGTLLESTSPKYSYSNETQGDYTSLRESEIVAAVRTGTLRKATETEQQMDARLRAQSVRTAKRPATKTEEEREDRLKAQRARTTKQGATETEQQREERLQAQRARVAKYKETETDLQREARLKAKRAWGAECIRNESHQKREARLEAYRLRCAKRRATDTELQREKRREADRLRHAKIRATETEQQREARLEAQRVRDVKRRSKSKKQRNARLDSQRAARTAKRKASEEEREVPREANRLGQAEDLRSVTEQQRDARDAQRVRDAKSLNTETERQREAQRVCDAERLSSETKQKRDTRLEAQRVRQLKLEVPELILSPTWIDTSKEGTSHLSPLTQSQSEVSEQQQMDFSAGIGITECKRVYCNTCKCYIEQADSSLTQHNKEFHNTSPKITTRKLMFLPMLKSYVRIAFLEPTNDNLQIPWYLCCACGRAFVYKIRALHHKKYICSKKVVVWGIPHSEIHPKSDDGITKNMTAFKKALEEIAKNDFGYADWTEVWKWPINLNPRRTYDETSFEAIEDTNKVKCKICQRVVLRRCFYAHAQRHDEEPWICQHCGLALADKMSYEGHVNIHTGEKPYKCRFCDKRYRSVPTRHDHENREHKGRNSFTCEKCGKTFRNIISLQQHKLSTHKEEPRRDRMRTFMCNTCQEVFSTLQRFKNHLKTTHQKIGGSGEGSLSCEQCKQTFESQNHLHDHIAYVHSSVQAKVSTENSELSSSSKKWRKTYAPSQCTECGKIVKGEMTLDRHMLVFHPKDGKKPKFFECKICHQSFSIICTMRTHLRTKHADILPAELLKANKVTIDMKTLDIEDYFIRLYKTKQGNWITTGETDFS